MPKGKYIFQRRMIIMSNTEIMTMEKFELGFNGSAVSALSEELDGLGAPVLDRIKIPSGGGLVFELPGENPETPDLATELEGVIVNHHPVNAYWADKYNGANESPDCSSFDGKTGIDQQGEVNDCSGCPYNSFGSDGKGKACKNMHRVYLLRSGEMMPMILTLPPTSLKNLKDYLQVLVMKKGCRPYQAVSKIQLKKDSNGDGIVYSKAYFTFVGVLPADTAALMADYSASIKRSSQNTEIGADEYIQK